MISYSIIINSPGYQFEIYYDKHNKVYNVDGDRWQYEDNAISIEKDVKTFDEIYNIVKKYIKSWCSVSIIIYDGNLQNQDYSKLSYHQVFKSIDIVGDNNVSFRNCIEMLRKLSEQ